MVHTFEKRQILLEFDISMDCPLKEAKENYFSRLKFSLNRKMSVRKREKEAN